MPTPPIAAPDRAHRFAGRVADYERGRPGYPEALFDRLVALAGLAPGAAVADIGAGTGIASEPLLRRGLRVFAVEPSDEMRAAAERRLGGDAGFRATAGRAEATGLDDASVELVIAAQAFHWFEPQATRQEPAHPAPRRPAALVWNARRADRHAVRRRLRGSAAAPRHRLRRGRPSRPRPRAPGGRSSAALRRRIRFDNAQALDRDGLRARLLSSSYVPARGEPGARRHARRPRHALRTRHAEAAP
jgi:SAM-dependent methyltransferase